MRRAILFTLVSFALSSTAYAGGQLMALQTPSLQVTKVSANGKYVVGSDNVFGYRVITATNVTQTLTGLDVALGINNFGTIAGAVPVNGGAANGGTDLGAYAPLGADPVPESEAEAEALIVELRGDLATSEAAREVARLVLSQRPDGAPAAVQRTLGTAAVDLLPPYARTMLALTRPLVSALPARMATRTMSETLRWAFRQR